jgi:hypothetical protein
MSKRARKQSEEVPRIQKFAISDEITLRIRYYDTNVDGSVMMFYKEKVYECHHLKEARAKEFTEPNWMTRCRKIYGDDDETDEEMKQYNENAKLFSDRMSVVSITNSCLAGPNAIKQDIRFSLVSLDENHILTFKMETDESSSESTIENTVHVSMRLRFVEIN